MTPQEIVQKFLDDNNLRLVLQPLTTKKLDNGGLVIEYSGVLVEEKEAPVEPSEPAK